jgi:GntR family transcriptional repressor for pyruvate dehydrogenase complex
MFARSIEAGGTLESESEMLDRYHVGRVSLREALRTLELYGLIRRRRGRHGGPIVCRLSGRTLARPTSVLFHALGMKQEQVLDALQAIEPVLAARAARHRSPEGAAALRAMIVEQERASDRAAFAWRMSGTAFHAAVSSLAKSPALDIVYEALLHIEASLATVPFDTYERAAVHGAHREIAEAISDGDRDSAQRLMRLHIDKQIECIRQYGVMGKAIGWF